MSTPTPTTAPAKPKIVLRRNANTETFPPQPKYNVTVEPSSTDNSVNAKQHRQAKIITSKYLSNQTKDNKEQIQIKRVIEIKLDLQSPDIHYLPGDYISIYSKNPTDIVTSLLTRLSLNSNDVVKVESVSTTTPTPAHITRINNNTIRNMFESELDICGIPSKRLLRLLGEYAQVAEEKSKLVNLSSVEGKDEYNKLIENRTTLLDLLNIYPSVQSIPLHYLLDFIAPLAPRDYSISSSPLLESTTVHFIFSVVDQVINGKKVKGLCTSWLEDKCLNSGLLTQQQQDQNEVDSISLDKLTLKEQEGEEKEIYIPYEFKSTLHFHLPQNRINPLIMIGPGTGVAPFIGFLQHLKLTKEEQTAIEDGERWLFFGCRSETYDFLFKKELQGYVTDRTLNQLITAFSRESNDAENTLGYVQEKILNHGKQLFDLIHNKKANVYICGDAKGMAMGVRSSFIEIIKQELKVDEKQAIEVFSSWITEKRYLLDVWA